MNSHLLNYRFSPDQSDIQYSPPHSTSAEMCCWTCEQPGSAWLLQLPRTPSPPSWGTSTRPLPSSLPYPRPLLHGKSESREGERVPVMIGGGEGEDERTVHPPPPGSSQPLPMGGRLNQWNQPVIVLAGLCWLDERAMASEALGQWARHAWLCSTLLLLVHLLLSATSSGL